LKKRERERERVGHIRRGNHKRTNKGGQSLGDATPIAPSYIHYAETSTGGLGWIDWIIAMQLK